MKGILSCILLAVSLFSSYSWAARGVAFVHGTGSHTDALNDYWTSDMVNSVRQGLPDSNNYVVVNCDFNQYMWDPRAAGCLASQLTTFIDKKGIDELVVITHSNGGNIIRWIESNPVSDARFPKIINAISEVIALAPSSLGTPLADQAINGNSFNKAVGWLLGYKTDAVKQQQVSTMAAYNANNLYGTQGRPSLPKPFKTVVGTGLAKSWNPINGGDYTCGGVHLHTGLTIAKKWGGLNSCSDGFLNCSSQAGAGSVWFYDKEKTTYGYLLSHNQSRRACFNLDGILRKNI